MNILLIGHQGYIGSGLHYYFQQHQTVVGWGRKDNLFSLTRRDLIRRKIDAIVNCAVITDRTAGPYDALSPTHRINVEGARHLANVLRGTKIGWVQISTKDVFGPVYDKNSVIERRMKYVPKFLVDEVQPFEPVTLYAKSKLMSEFISQSHPLSSVVRLSSCYSDFDHHRGNWMVNLIRASINRSPITLSHNGKQFRDPLHTDDLGRLVERIIEKKLYGESFNAGGGSQNLVSILEFLDIIGSRSQIKKIPGTDFGFAFDIQKANRLAGWSPYILLKDRLLLLIENIRNRITAEKYAIISSDRQKIKGPSPKGRGVGVRAQ